MSRTRVYVPSSWAGLRALLADDGIGPPPIVGHAVTDALRAAYPEGSDEEWEYVAAANASRTSLCLLGDADPPRRVVLALDVDTVVDAHDEDPTLIELVDAVPFRQVAAVLVDLPEAAVEVAAARSRWAEAEAGDAGAEQVVERCLDHELAWYAPQEIGELLQAQGWPC
jgi:hypothetical protein